jgi:hypothetical protein
LPGTNHVVLDPLATRRTGTREHALLGDELVGRLVAQPELCRPLTALEHTQMDRVVDGEAQAAVMRAADGKALWPTRRSPIEREQHARAGEVGERDPAERRHPGRQREHRGRQAEQQTATQCQGHVRSPPQRGTST